MNNEDDWAFVTVTYNSASDLRRFWGEGSPVDVDWVVVDNASSDGSADLAEALGARVIRLDRNVGFGAANNIGISSSRASLVACVNPDVKVDFTTTTELARTIRATGAFVAPQLTFPDGGLQPNGRGAPSLLNKVRNRLNRVDRYNLLAQPGEIVSVCWAMGAAICASRETWASVGGWDEAFFVYYEDAELGLKGWEQGIATWIDGSVRWEHGWARETTTFRVGPWRREVRSAFTFYSRRPALLIGEAPFGYGETKRTERLHD